MAVDLKTQRAKWVILFPIQNLQLTDSVDNEYKIDRVTFVSSKRLAGRRRRLGIPWRVGEKKKKAHPVGRLLDSAPTVGVVRVTGTVNAQSSEVINRVRDELAILGASQLGYAKRRVVGAPCVLGERSVTKHSMLWASKHGWVQPNRLFGPFMELRLDEDWLEFQKKVFFSDLMRMITAKVGLSKSWKNELRKATILIGLSQSAYTLPDAFLWNMIALELLLTKQGDQVKNELPSRAEALLGWSVDWSKDNFGEKIKEVYAKRCLMVHQGDRASATSKDLYFTDDLLLSLLVNIAGHPKLFASKEHVVQFSKRVEAERLLGVKARVRPKSLRFLKRKYTQRDFEIY